MASDVKKEATLVKAVFSGEKGKELLELWQSQYKTILMSTDREQSALVGQQIFIDNINFYLNATSSDLKEMDEAQSYEEDNF